MNPIKQGDYFMLPFAGRPVDLLVRAERPMDRYSGHWITSNWRGEESFYLLSSCQRVPPSKARLILQRAARSSCSLANEPEPGKSAQSRSGED